MNNRLTSHLFWGSHSPLSALSGTGLIILASSRFAFAIVCAFALLWVYGFTILIFSGAKSIMPSRGRMLILLFLSSLICGLFMLFISILNPLLIFGTAFFLVLIPPCCLGSGFFEATESVDTTDALSRAVYEALTLAVIILALALIREPLGMLTISFPGGVYGIAELFSGRDADALVPVRLMSVSAGGLLLFGYATAMYRYFRERNIPRNKMIEEEEQ
jgi:Na+-transporting NADH:ubiquinone oxidoreductase subunit NqrD